MIPKRVPVTLQQNRVPDCSGLRVQGLPQDKENMSFTEMADARHYKSKSQMFTLLCMSSSSCRLASMAFRSCLSSVLLPRPAPAATLSRLDSAVGTLEVGSFSPSLSSSCCPYGGHGGVVWLQKGRAVLQRWEGNQESRT